MLDGQEICPVRYKMGEIFDFEREKLIIGVIYSDEEILNKAMERVFERFGPYDMVSEEFSFSKE